MEYNSFDTASAPKGRNLEKRGTFVAHKDSPLPPALLRTLGDRSQDKRKTAANEVMGLIRLCTKSGDLDKVRIVITLLASDFVQSRNPNHRKGGCTALAASAVGLQAEKNLKAFIFPIMAPVIKTLEDSDSTVAYHACEAIYNITKAGRSLVLELFSGLFDGMCNLYSVQDSELHAAATCLDNLLKDIVADSDTFDLDDFLPMLQHQLTKERRHANRVATGWCSMLYGVPDLNFLDQVPSLMGGLFQMLEDDHVSDFSVLLALVILFFFLFPFSFALLHKRSLTPYDDAHHRGHDHRSS